MKHRTREAQMARIIFGALLICIGGLVLAYDVAREGDYVWACLDGDTVVSRHDTPYRAQDDCGDLADELGRPLRIDFGGLVVTPDAPVDEPEPPIDPPVEPPVEPINTPPEWIRVTRPNFTAGTSGTYYLAVDSRDADGDALTYSAEPDLPAGITLQGDKLTHDGSTAPGTYDIVIEASDGAATAHTDTVTITVRDAVGEPPSPPPVETSGALHWRAPTEWTDGRAIDEISGFRIYEGEVLRLVVSGDIRAIDMPPGCYRMTAVSEGIQSPLSNQGCVE